MKLAITVDVPESLALELVPEGSFGPSGEGGVKAILAGRVVASGPHGLAVLFTGMEPVDAELSREPTRSERVSAIDARYIDEELSS